MSTVHLHGKLSRAEALAALFNAAKPQGLGKLQYNASHVMDELEAEMILAKGEYVDYLEGRVIKTKFDSDIEIDTTLYDRDNGEDAGAAAIFSATDRKLYGNRFGAEDRMNGGCFSSLNLPYKLMGHKVEKGGIFGLPSYVYTGVMGGRLHVAVRGNVSTLMPEVTIFYEHPDLGDNHVQLRAYAELLSKGGRKEFSHLVTRVINEAMRKMMMDGEKN